MPETCRVSWQNKILDTWCILLVIYTKIITIHGHLNIKHVKQSAADSRQGTITELRGRPEDCLRHCACYKIQNWQDFGKTKATGMGDGTGTMERQKSLQNRCIKNTSKIIRKIKLTFSNSTGDHVGQQWHWASRTLHNFSASDTRMRKLNSGSACYNTIYNIYLPVSYLKT